jgi:plasmid stabilization system protein ParE
LRHDFARVRWYLSRIADTPGSTTLPDDLHPGDRKIAERACVAFYRLLSHL